MKAVRARPAAGDERLTAREGLLRACGRFRLGPPEGERLARAASEASEADWSAVLAEAIRRGGGGLLFHHLCAAGAEPPAALRDEYRRIAASNVAWGAELRRLGGALREAGVPVLLIKGAALQEDVYQNSGVRLMEDVDWVLRGEAQERAATGGLEDLGYRPWGEAYRELWVSGSFLLDLHRHPLGDERIEARTSGLAGEGAPEEAIWRRARRSPLGEPYLVPAAEDHLLILCAHLMKHSFEPGIWFADLEALLAYEPAFDWAAALARARAWGLIRPLAYAFRNLGALEGEGAQAPALPERVREALREVRPTRLDRALLALAARSAPLAGEKPEWERPPVANLLWLSSQEGLGAKARLLWEAAFPRDEVMAQIFPGYRPSLRWWYVLRRAGALLRLGIRLARRL